MTEDETSVLRMAMWTIGTIFFFVALWIGVASAVWGFEVATAGIYGRGEAQRQIQSAPHRIAAYNHFFDLCAGVRIDEQSLEAQAAQLEATDDSFQRTRIQTNITGLIGHRASLIEEYNANARKDYTEAQFRDSDLPYQIPATAWKNGDRTSCGG
ncbi:MAG: hypothetical protein A2932_01675 [Candidatus Spechtbacteria bacterium RIFCSPLOWO2_01_FULL_46_10]|uniref:LemA family protein n=1 Tax=Candidatus Spechtbacteria bacterium RIFCSPLOWO2_01_FULL_46_10 TaxID=1802163 RepID=A0A1G2HG54_9BACT|nr:MAG: hypothetical protein A2932_01675 [Candidatus Spechtbacteria bacterium RIFCSPLOWO2_01_FULL_46_10]